MVQTLLYMLIVDYINRVVKIASLHRISHERGDTCLSWERHFIADATIITPHLRVGNTLSDGSRRFYDIQIYPETYTNSLFLSFSMDQTP